MRTMGLRPSRVCETINTIVTHRPAPRKRATLRDLAEITGLSPAGAHYALRGERVAPATADRVRRTAARIGFRSDPVARALRGGASGLVGVIGGSLSDYWHQEFASELQRHLRRRGRHMLLADADGDHDTEIELAASLIDQRVDGLVALPVRPASERWLPIVAAVPTVAVGAPLPAPARSIRFATEAGIELVLDRLAALGHRRVLALTGGVHPIPRRAGLRRVTCGFSAGDAAAATASALRRRPRPTAVFALSDALAYGAYAACRELGLEVPADVSIAGFDDHPLSALLAPALSTVSWDTPRAARIAVSMLAATIDGRGGRSRLELAPRLVERGSTAPPGQPVQAARRARS
jgi:LacI family transcriptional regulator